MIRVTLHHSPPSRISANNVLGRLDIGYAKLDALADYKAVMVAAGIGELPPIHLSRYPRWSASVWDLIVRVACVATGHAETLPPFEDSGGRGGAFMENLTAQAERWPDGVRTEKSLLGIAHVRMRSRRREYTASFEDDILPVFESTVFTHTPKMLDGWGLMVRAFAWAASERFELPPRPKLYVPIPMTHGDESVVALDTLQEPARTGIRRWLSRSGIPTVASDLVSGPCVTESQFVEFLRSAP